ncbi:Kynureninase (L-kynurenine hydrolase) [Arthrobotrys musiformis]|uniref:Kynureninase n=1 Tax=Arthrobotrys musiformis TaxID=47236 RepID=A0AAV9VTI2_9PEZI
MAGTALPTAQRASELDSRDQLRLLRNDFHIPKHPDFQDSCHATNKELDCQPIYLCGNSLGLQPKGTRALLLEELDVWADRGVHGHHNHPKSRPWIDIDECVSEEMAKIVGAHRSEVAIMGTLTSNLHFLMAAFYRPTDTRYKVIVEDKAFPSDYYAIESQVRWHGLNPSDAIISITPRPGQYTLNTSDIIEVIQEHGSSVAMILLPGVQYYTGQLFEIEKITKIAKASGITVGWDLAHAAGNVELSLHDWQVDFAAWCSYKYLNSGPGGIAGIFVHEARSEQGRLTGWWGHDRASRFKMENDFIPIPGAGGFQHSNPSVMATVCLLGSLRIFAKTTMRAIREKSVLLTGYMEELLLADEQTAKFYQIITPRNPSERGAQLSLLFKGGIMDAVFHKLELAGIIADKRDPDVIRVAPAPLYNSYEDVFNFSMKLREAILEVSQAVES